jgi:uncharacterized BrkB/YihY/UPF0761 family membrane protein
LIYGFGSFTYDYFAGAATAGFGVWGEVGGVGMYFTYVMAYFIALVVVLPILIIKRFWVGMAVYALYALSGLYLEYYFELVVEQNLVGYWAVGGWCVLGLATGLCADLVYRFLPSRLSEKWRAILTGLTIGVATFAAVTIALSYFYVEKELVYSANYFSIAYYGVPFMLVSSGFGGYTAYAISKRV